MDADIVDMARHWYGYGRWEAKYWFIGPEPGMNSNENDLRQRCNAWVELGRDELIDCKDHHFGFGEMDWHRETPPPLPQRTWIQLIRLLLGYRHGTAPNIREIVSYQQKTWGMKNGETCVIELSSIAASNLAAPGQHDLFREERIREIRQRILRYKPTFVVMYGKLHRPHWEAIAGSPFGPDNLLTMGSTTAAFARHPVSYGLANDYWLQLAQKLRDQNAKTTASPTELNAR